MDPKSAERMALRQELAAKLGPQNLYAIQCYTQALQRYGVRRLHVALLVL